MSRPRVKFSRLRRAGAFLLPFAAGILLYAAPLHAAPLTMGINLTGDRLFADAFGEHVQIGTAQLITEMARE